MDQQQKAFRSRFWHYISLLQKHKPSKTASFFKFSGWEPLLLSKMGQNRLRVCSECIWQNNSWVTSRVVAYIYDGSLVIQERDQNNTPTVTYTRGLDLSRTCCDAAGGIGGLLARTDNAALLGGSDDPHAYYHADGNGNVTLLVNSDQLPVARYLYDPYGNTIAQSGALADVNEYRFSSKEYHSKSGLYNFGRRFYDPKLQRWPNRDPIGIEGGINLYAFVKNGPLSRVDPMGTDILPVILFDPSTPLSPFSGLAIPPNVDAQQEADLVARGYANHRIGQPTIDGGDGAPPPEEPGSGGGGGGPDYCEKLARSIAGLAAQIAAQPNPSPTDVALLSIMTARYELDCSPKPKQRPPIKNPRPRDTWWRKIPPIWRYPIVIPIWEVPRFWDPPRMASVG